MELITCWPPEDTDPAVSSDLSSEQEPDRNNIQDGKKATPKRSFDEVDNPAAACIHVPPRKIRHPPDSDEPFAGVSLARWWRATGKHSAGSKVLTPHSSNPNTFLRHLTRLPEAQDFLRSEISRLVHQVDTSGATARTGAVLATFLEKVGRLEEAEIHIKAAVEKDPEDKEYRWLRHRISRKRKVLTEQNKALKRLNSRDLTQLTTPPTVPVAHCSAKELSVSQFRFRFAASSTPVVVTGLVHSMTPVPWTLSHIRESAGSTEVKLKKLVAGSVDWAGLEDAETRTVAEVIDSLTHQGSLPVHEQRYLFDWSLPLYCPKLAREITIPDYFSDNLLTQTPPCSLYRDSWPSLFVAPRGLRSELHVDAFGSNFWMALFEGRKRWVFFNKEDLPLLYPCYESGQSTDPVFEVNLRNPDLTKHPLLSLATPMECVLQPGELLFVPAGCPHYVENLDQSLAISSNFVDESNWELARGELEVNGLLDERSQELLDILETIRQRNK